MFNPWNAPFLSYTQNTMNRNDIAICENFLTFLYEAIKNYGISTNTPRTDIRLLDTTGIIVMEDQAIFVFVFYENPGLPKVEFKTIANQHGYPNLETEMIKYVTTKCGSVVWSFSTQKSEMHSNHRNIAITKSKEYFLKSKEEIKKTKEKHTIINNGLINNAPMSNCTIQIGQHNNTTIEDNHKQTFDDLRQLIQTQVVDNQLILEALIELEDNYGKGSFVEKYNNFIQSAANHITLLAPFIPALTTMFK